MVVLWVELFSKLTMDLDESEPQNFHCYGPEESMVSTHPQEKSLGANQSTSAVMSVNCTDFTLQAQGYLVTNAFQG